MKKATILLAAAMTGMLFGPAAAAAQNPDPQTDTTAIEVVKESSSSTPASDMVLRSDNKSGSLALEIAGYQIMLSSPDRNDQKESTRSKVKWSFGAGHMEFGFNALVKESYSGYPDNLNNFMSLRLSKSIHFAFRPLMLTASINKYSRSKARWDISTGLKITNNDLTFSDNITLQKQDGRIMPVELDKAYKKSKLAVTQLGFPLTIGYTHRPSNLGFSVTLNNDLLLNARTKYKRPKTKQPVSFVRSFSNSIQVTMTYKNFGIYADYALSPLFKDNMGVQTRIVSFGFVIK